MTSKLKRRHNRPDSNKDVKNARFLVASIAMILCLGILGQEAQAQGGFMGPNSGYMGGPMMAGSGSAASSAAASGSAASTQQVQQTTTQQTTSSTAAGASTSGSAASAAGSAAGGIGMGGMGGSSAAGAASAASGSSAATTGAASTTQQTTTTQTSTAAGSSAASSAAAAGGATGGIMGGYGYDGYGMGGAAGGSSAASSSAASAGGAGGSSASSASSAASGAAGAGLGGPYVPYGGFDSPIGAAAAAASGSPYADLGGEALAGAAAGAAAVDGGPIVAPGTLLARQALATDALINAQAESAIAGADMVAHGANNARSASLASNAYRQAKLASARDRVNIAGTIQNTARISDAAIATHDAATKAEDSLLGSELAVDSAGTVLDSDGAYIPPVTASLLRSLPYGRIGIRNIMPKPLTHSANLLPDVWLNGQPVNYANVPLRMLPYGIGGSMAQGGQYLGAGLATASAGAGPMISGQTLIPSNGIPLSSRYFDPSAAYIVGSMRGIMDSSVLPVLANGQLEAHDEVAMANMLRVQQENGPGMIGTSGGYGRINHVPMLTGTVSDVNLMPTTTTGTTYPIGSALVIEPRDSFFQDYVDSASSRQNFDEHEQ